MNLDNENNLGYVASLRYMQHLHEWAELRNPDHLVGRLFPLGTRLRHRWMGKQQLSALRAQPFYYYLLARTHHYDDIYQQAIASGVHSIINLGCGSDTRAHRFQSELLRAGTVVLECDRRHAIAAKKDLVRRLGAAPHVHYLALDLHDAAWPDLEAWLDRAAGSTVLVMMEGVSPYVDAKSFGRFLAFLGATLPRASRVSYDYKLAGVAEGFGGDTHASGPCFRLPGSRAEVAAMHEALGLRLDHFEPGQDLQHRVTPSVMAAGIAPFLQDALISLVVA